MTDYNQHNFKKDPNAVKDYTIDLEDWLDGDTIASIAVSVDTGITLDSNSNTTTTATAIISGGTKGITYGVHYRITTANGIIDDFHVDLYIQDADTAASSETAYATVTEAETYLQGVLHINAWRRATPTDRSKALIEATRRIDRLNFRGARTSTSQTFQFPRDEDSTIPDDIKNACIEFALVLLDGVVPEVEIEAALTNSFGYSNVRSSRHPDVAPEYIMAGIPSLTAWRYLRPYLRDPNQVDMLRVS